MARIEIPLYSWFTGFNITLGMNYTVSHCQTSKIHQLLVIALLSFAYLLVPYSSVEALAGPVARELTEKGNNVGIPKQRPRRFQSIQAAPTAAKKQPAAPQMPVRLPTRISPPATETPTQTRSHTEPQPNSTCLAQLRKLAIVEIAQTPAAEDPACTIPDPVLLVRTKSNRAIDFTAGLILDCPFALALVRFADDTVQALSEHHLGSSIKKIDSGEGFVCRRRNNSPTGKISEHAFGNATDWVGFRLGNGDSLAISDAAQLRPGESAFLNSVRSAACGTFTTVLGPGSNAAHARHFHFDLGRSKDRKNPYRICE